MCTPSPKVAPSRRSRLRLARASPPRSSGRSSFTFTAPRAPRPSSVFSASSARPRRRPSRHHRPSSPRRRAAFPFPGVVARARASRRGPAVAVAAAVPLSRRRPVVRGGPARSPLSRRPSRAHRRRARVRGTVGRRRARPARGVPRFPTARAAYAPERDAEDRAGGFPSSVIARDARDVDARACGDANARPSIDRSIVARALSGFVF